VPAREGIGRVFNNATVIPRFANALFQLQLKQVQLQLKEAYIEAVRFGINSTLGLGGGSIWRISGLVSSRRIKTLA
jgi:ABC-type transporter lipoprotein component MlaA